MQILSYLGLVINLKIELPEGKAIGSRIGQHLKLK